MQFNEYHTKITAYDFDINCRKKLCKLRLFECIKFRIEKAGSLFEDIYVNHVTMSHLIDARELINT